MPEAHPDSKQIIQDNRDYTLFSWSAQAQTNPIHMVGGQGSHFFDGDGHTWLDFSSQLININVGHQHPKVLQAIKDDPALLSIPVVMLSTSSQPGDIARAYTLHASSYMVKSNSFQKFVDQVDAFVTFWRESRTPSWPDRPGS